VEEEPRAKVKKNEEDIVISIVNTIIGSPNSNYETCKLQNTPYYLSWIIENLDKFVNMQSIEVPY